MRIIRLSLAGLAPLFAASGLGALVSVAWLAHSDFVCKITVGICVVAFGLWPAGSIWIFVRLGGVPTRLASLGLVGVALLSVPAFGLILDACILHLTGHAATRSLWAIVLAGGLGSTLCGVLMMWPLWKRVFSV